MQFTVSKKALADACNHIKAALGDSGTIQALSCVLLEAAPGHGIKLSTTNLVTTMQAVVTTDVAEGGKLCVQGRPLINIVNAISGDTVKVELKDKQLSVSGGSSRFKINTMSAQEFPMLPNPQSDFAALPSDYVIDLFDRLLFAASGDVNRPALTGVNLTPGRAESTDGHRLVVIREHKLPVKRAMVLPAGPIKSVVALLPRGKDEEVEFSYGEREVHFRFKQRLATVRLIEEQFPETDRVIPGGAHHQVTVDRQALIEALQRASLVINAQRVVALNFKSGEIELVTTGDHGEAQETVPAESVKELSMRCSCDYLLESLGHLREKTVSMEIRAPLVPLVFREGECLHVVMPRSK